METPQLPTFYEFTCSLIPKDTDEQKQLNPSYKPEELKCKITIKLSSIIAFRPIDDDIYPKGISDKETLVYLNDGIVFALHISYNELKNMLE